ncbi:50S ribosomal protein L11 methyltransferase [Leeuwenhoekiella marinoflava]|uniref:Ribosomal protein L11 methyltransferase n=2 Tax=Leeuwenhoekiella marinoflava TaxID=988 RepID=A0A4Q0PJH5_9FLAO|nr:50S ribosomal protein L11 methyltransferase [Leeuwenhoekiella marinoflava]RXG27588.1 [LSU ribosomal protein L11P]-lysine N-methyltransferase [Leeuwenhoekiella marinoflava]SHF66428.1 [LSU ribosomal protein L11P]-lysine N-methyltransferase [Leeuwenhoekiella marinoflava DSM 3653]
MAEAYSEYEFKVAPVNPGAEILIAELSQLDFESFDETEEGVKAYILSALDKEDLLEDIYLLKNPEFEISYAVKLIEPINWNEEWEKNFEPIEVDGICSVRAPFHPKPDTEFDIVIEPKMSFGTGHHETTHLMIKHLLKIEIAGLRTLDMGCGTGILAILAALKGAKPVDAIDIDPWCYENTVENVSRNGVDFIKTYEGDSSILKGKQYDLIIANINRNILIDDIPTYAGCLNHEGILLLSGFYTQDIPAITNVCNQHGLNFIMNFEKNNWVACKFVKN